MELRGFEIMDLSLDLRNLVSGGLPPSFSCKLWKSSNVSILRHGSIERGGQFLGHAESKSQSHPLTIPITKQALARSLNSLLVKAPPNPTGANPRRVSMAPSLSPPATHPIPRIKCASSLCDVSMRRWSMNTRKSW